MVVEGLPTADLVLAARPAGDNRSRAIANFRLDKKQRHECWILLVVLEWSYVSRAQTGTPLHAAVDRTCKAACEPLPNPTRLLPPPKPTPLAERSVASSTVAVPLPRRTRIEVPGSGHCTKAQAEPARHHRESEDLVGETRIFRVLNGSGVVVVTGT